MCFRPLTRIRCGSWMIPNQLCEKVVVSPFSSIQSRFAFPEVFCLWNKLQLLRRLSPKDSVPGPYEILGLRHRYRLVLFWGGFYSPFSSNGASRKAPNKKNWWRLGGSFEKAGDPASWHKPFYELRSWHVSRVGVSQAPEKCVLKIQWKLEGGPVRGFVWNGLALIFIQFVLHSFFLFLGDYVKSWHLQPLIQLFHLSHSDHGIRILPSLGSRCFQLRHATYICICCCWPSFTWGFFFAQKYVQSSKFPFKVVDVGNPPSRTSSLSN